MASTEQARRIHPADVEWEQFHDPHGRPTSPVRMLKTDAPALLEVDFPPDFHAGLHWHPFDTLYFVAEGEMRIGPEGSFFPGDVRWVKAGHPYGPEEAGPDGVRFFLISLGDEVGLNWADIYDVPATLGDRLSGLSDLWGRVNMDDVPSNPLPGSSDCQVQTLSGGDPYIQRVRIAPGGTLGAYSHDVDTLYLLRGGSMEVDGEGGFETEDARWMRAGQPSGATKAGPDGADLILIGIGSLSAFDWDSA